MDISATIASLKPSPTVALNGKAKEMAAEGFDVINLSVGEPDFPTAASVVKVAQEALQAGRTKYGPAGGGAKLRRSIAHKLKRDNQLDYTADDVVVGVGAKEILFHISLGLLNPGDEVLIPAPYWVSYPAHAQAAGAVPITVPMPEDPGLTLTPDMLEAKATAKTKMLVLNYPNNPSGAVLSKEALMALGKYLQTKDWWIISDEIYEYLSFDSSHLSLLTVCPELKDRTLVVNGCSKGFAMTGWRVGYCAGPKQATAVVKKLQSQSSTCLPPFIEEAAAFALGQGAALMTDGVALLRERRKLVTDRLAAIEGMKFVPPKGAFYAFMDLRHFTSDTMTFGKTLLEEFHVAMVPGEAFGAPGFMRMSYAAANDRLEQGLDRLEKALAKR